MSNIVYQGRDSLKNTEEYREKKYKIIKKINEKFDPLINNEKNFFKRIKLILSKKNKLKKELEIIDSKKILFIKGNK